MGIKLNSSSGGSVEINPPATASTFTLTAPAINDTIVTKTSTDTLTNKTLTSPVITGASMSSMSSSVLTSMTAQNTTSGTFIDFTGIPSWARRVTVMFNGVSTSGSSSMQIQVGSGSILTSGYKSTANYAVASTAQYLYASSGLILEPSGTTGSSATRFGIYTLCLFGSNTWTASGNIGADPTIQVTVSCTGVTPTLSGALDRIRITTVNGTDTLDAGSVNVMYE